MLQVYSSRTLILWKLREYASMWPIKRILLLVTASIFFRLRFVLFVLNTLFDRFGEISECRNWPVHNRSNRQNSKLLLIFRRQERQYHSSTTARLCSRLFSNLTACVSICKNALHVFSIRDGKCNLKPFVTGKSSSFSLYVLPKDFAERQKQVRGCRHQTD